MVSSSCSITIIYDIWSYMISYMIIYDMIYEHWELVSTYHMSHGPRAYDKYVVIDDYMKLYNTVSLSHTVAPCHMTYT